MTILRELAFHAWLLLARYPHIFEGLAAVIAMASYCGMLFCGVHRIEAPVWPFVAGTAFALVLSVSTAFAWCLRPEEMRK